MILLMLPMELLVIGWIFNLGSFFFDLIEHILDWVEMNWVTRLTGFIGAVVGGLSYVWLITYLTGPHDGNISHFHNDDNNHIPPFIFF